MLRAEAVLGIQQVAVAKRRRDAREQRVVVAVGVAQQHVDVAEPRVGLDEQLVGNRPRQRSWRLPWYPTEPTQPLPRSYSVSTE